MKGNNTAERIKTFRESTGLSQREFAARCGMSQGHLSKIEAGVHHVGRKVAEALELGTGGLLKKEQLMFGE